MSELNGVQLVLDKITALDTRFSELKAERETFAADKAAIDKQLGEFKAEIAKLKESAAHGQRLSLPGFESAKQGEQGRFSYARMLFACMNPSLLDEKEYGYERDVYIEMRKRLDGLPLEYRTAINAASGAGGAFLIPTQAHEEMIPQLRERSIARQIGATVLDGLTPGNHTWAKSRGGVVAEHLNTEEEADGTETVPTFDQIQLTPRPIAAFVPLTFGMQTQAPATLESWVRNEIATQIGLLEDQSFFVGSGALGAPRGVCNHPQIQTGTTLTLTDAGTLWAGLVKMILASRTKFALGLSGLGWAAAPRVLFGLMGVVDGNKRPAFESLTAGNMANTTVPGRLAGYPIVDSAQISTADNDNERLVFGPWGDALLAHWGTMAFAMSDQTEKNFRKARVTVRGIMQYDVGVFHGDAFVQLTNVDTAGTILG